MAFRLIHPDSLSGLSTPALVAGVCCVAFFGAGCATGGGSRTPFDSGARDTQLNDDGGVDSSVRDSATTDTGARDSGITLMDTGAGDTGTADTGSTDTGTADTGRVDTGPAPECMNNADCSDGLACTGTETCVAGRCVGGTAVACDDGVACTMDGCAEPGGTCTHTPSDALCGVGETCDATLDCQPSSTCSESPCRLVAPQCGCAAGEGCYLSGGTRVCVTAGTTAVGARCDTTQCQPGAICVNIASTGASTPICHRVCATDGDCPGTGALCLGGIMGSSDKTCTVDCDPATQTGCPTGTACDFFTESMGAMRTLTDCTAPVGTGGQNASCTATSDCQKGFTCLTVSTGVKQCLHWCRLPAGSECPGLTDCFGFTTPIIWNSTEYGVCN